MAQLAADRMRAVRMGHVCYLVLSSSTRTNAVQATDATSKDPFVRLYAYVLGREDPRSSFGAITLFLSLPRPRVGPLGGTK